MDGPHQPCCILCLSPLLLPPRSSAADALPDTLALPAGAENSYNLFCVRKNADAATDEDRSRLEVRVGSWVDVSLLVCGQDDLLSKDAVRLCCLYCRLWGGTTWASLSTASSTARSSCACQIQVGAVGGLLCAPQWGLQCAVHVHCS